MVSFRNESRMIRLNYIGSKYSLLDFLLNTIEGVTNIKEGTNLVFADLFAGTGVVGSAFKKKGYKVIANDIQYYSYVVNKHNIENNYKMDNSIVDYLNSLEGTEGFIFINYCAGSGSGRNYFTDYNGKKCDAIRNELEKLHIDKKISESQYYYYLASLINSMDKLANTASVYGAFLKHIKKSAQKELILELLPIIEGNPAGKVYNENINNLISEIAGDILYLDPPYNARQYCANYHVLETISRYDNPIVKGKTGLRNYDSQKSLYCSKRTVAQTFEDLISQANFKYVFVSYNNEGLMSLNTIKEIMCKYGDYQIFTKEYRRFKADKHENRIHKASSTLEYLHCITR
ncbi:MAG: modification methylase [Epulopiscium sp. Nele67-Bin002]|nr:MAG: modification methylase [Epulopiscium sp. Nuni2H_MBin001]OON91325.1 MAG: modification methylase [Epulopiscium sp. Nele67-Bin002]OON91382.1 MAG: modification methylase [Epulopiscium sp. Nele67-Bin001]